MEKPQWQALNKIRFNLIEFPLTFLEKSELQQNKTKQSEMKKERGEGI